MNTSANAYRPFQIGLLASGLFFVGYIAFGWQGWGTPAAVEQAVGEVSRWCERVQPGLFHEPVNALSNLGFMIAGLWMLWLFGWRCPGWTSGPNVWLQSCGTALCRRRHLAWSRVAADAWYAYGLGWLGR